MNKKLVTLFSVVILSSATTTFADTLSLGGDSQVLERLRRQKQNRWRRNQRKTSRQRL